MGLALVAGTALVLWLSGSRFTKGYVARHGRMPPATWMFRRTDDPALERERRTALMILPFCLAGAVLYVLFSGPAA